MFNTQFEHVISPDHVTRAEFDSARRNLGRFVEFRAAQIARDIGISFRESDECPVNGKQIAAMFEHCRRTVQPFPVYSGGCENTIYPIAADNLAFRFWHDWLHWQHGATVSNADEKRLAAIHMREVERAFGKGSLESRIIYADVAGQSDYYAKTGNYVADQLEFVFDYINRGNRGEG